MTTPCPSTPPPKEFRSMQEWLDYYGLSEYEDDESDVPEVDRKALGKEAADRLINSLLKEQESSA